MKKQLQVALLLVVIPLYCIYGDEVSKEVQKKSILLEEFTGIHCGYCPQGHKIANTLSLAQPDATYVIAIHSGHFAEPLGKYEPDFRIDEGEALDTEFGIGKAGYPSGMVNRHVFAGSSAVYSRNEWIKLAKQIHSEDAPLNLWMKSEYDGATRQLKVKVQGYYTGDNQENDLHLNVVWTQDNIKGFQNGSGVADDYVHQHMLRGYITTLWGDELTAPVKGETFEKEYLYQLPESVKKTEVKPEDINVIAFVTSGKKNVLNVTGGKPVYINYEKPLGGLLSEPEMEIGLRYGYNYFEAKLKNLSDKEITSADFDVVINDISESVSWEGKISSFSTLPITLKVSPYNINESNTYKIILKSINGQTVENSTIQGEFAGVLETTPFNAVTIQTDLYADENRFMIKDADGNIIKEFGPYVTDKKAVYKETAQLEPDKIYCLEISDAWGDGIQSPKGYLKIHNDRQVLVEQNYDIRLYGYRSFFRTSLSPTGISEHRVDKLYRYDNQNKIISMTDTSIPCIVSVYSIDGKCLLQSNDYILPVSSIPAGIYLLKIRQGKEFVNTKISLY